ncbi:MAG TPA: hypothetical protein VKM72_34275 [Thermoanaerobaculia bacterium]|nr:hypothetical protein [Thermoanaerobaculia bacterium]
MRTSRPPVIFTILSALALLLLATGVAGASVVYDFTTPAADAALSSSTVGVMEAGGIPLVIEAGLLDHDGNFELGGESAALSVRLTPVEFSPGVGLGVLSGMPSGSFPEDGLSMAEGLVFHFSPLFAPMRLQLSGITLGGSEAGEAFEAVRLFVNGQHLLDRKGEPDGTLTIALPAGTSTLALMPLLQPTAEIEDLSSDPVFFVAAIEGEATAVEVDFDLKPGSCENQLNTKSKGVYPAAILGTPALHVADIDPASIRLAGVAPIRASIGDAGRPGRCAAGKDGIPDLTLKVDTEAIVRALRMSLGMLRDGQRIVVPLEGQLRDGTPLIGEDMVLIQVPGK